MAFWRNLFLAFSIAAVTSCSFNPFRTDNELTGSAASTAVGAAVGGLTAAGVGGSKPEIGLAGLAGGLVGYYVSTLRFASGGILHFGGQVYTVGERVGIVIPSDVLFDVNSADFVPGAGGVLDSVVAVLERYPTNSILISGNTSGFSDNCYEREISEARARQVAAYLWDHGINSFETESIKTRKLVYVGYGDYFPIANTIRAEGIRQNSRIQITSYPSRISLGYDEHFHVYNNIGASDDANPAQTVAVASASQNTSAEPDALRGEMSDDYQSGAPPDLKGELMPS